MEEDKEELIDEIKFQLRRHLKKTKSGWGSWIIDYAVDQAIKNWNIRDLRELRDNLTR